MISRRQAAIRTILLTSVLIGTAAAASAASAQSIPIVQPGAPGQPVRPLTAQEASQIANTRFSPDDARYMQDMIHHHYQALEMAALVKGRTSRREVIDASNRIDASQEGEIKFMRDWLLARAPGCAQPGAACRQHAMPAMRT